MSYQDDDGPFQQDPGDVDAADRPYAAADDSNAEELAALLPRRSTSTWWGLRGVSVGPYVPKREGKFVTDFPHSLERKLRVFDDAGIRLCQGQRLSTQVERGLYWFSLILTSIVAIETGIVLPFIAFFLGWDDLGLELAYTMLITALWSQVPKRFVWRYRPWMSGRARKYRHDYTSSFPSRATTCVMIWMFCGWIVWSYFLHRAGLPAGEAWEYSGWIVGMIVGALLVSYARIYLGSHYPSDCLAGVVQGTILYFVAWGVRRGMRMAFACVPCFDELCYAGIHNMHPQINSTTIGHDANWPLAILLSLGFLILAILAGAPPLHFWEKCSHVFGLIFPCLLFSLTFLCPAANVPYRASLPPPPSALTIPWFGWVWVSVWAASATAIGWSIKGRWNIFAFVVLYVGTALSLILWRVIVWPAV